MTLNVARLYYTTCTCIYSCQNVTKISILSVLQLLQCNYIRQAIDLMEGLIPMSDDGKSDVPRDYLLKIIVMAIMWSVGAILELADRKKVGVVTDSRLITFIHVILKLLKSILDLLRSIFCLRWSDYFPLNQVLPKKSKINSLSI